MKRSVSILLLFIFLFNVGGYYVVFWGLHSHASRELTERLDADKYSAEETIQIKIPVTMPYPLQQTGYERVNGKFEHQGQFYRLVKQKLENDTIYIICIRDIEEKGLRTSMKNYLEKTTDLPMSSKNALQAMGKLLKEVRITYFNLKSQTSGWSQNLQRPEMTFNTHEPVHSLSSPPPEV